MIETKVFTTDPNTFQDTGILPCFLFSQILDNDVLR